MKIILFTIIILIPLIGLGQGINSDYYESGKLDAKLYYHDKNFKKGFGIGLGTVIGIPFEIWHIATKPKMEKLMMGNPNDDLLKNEYYYKGYSSSAHIRKGERSFLGFAAGFATTLSIIFIISSFIVDFSL